MAIKRYIANTDTTITNAFEANLTTRGTGSNMGASDSLEVFSVYGQTVTGSSNATSTSELSRILVNFPVSAIETDRTNTDIPVSGSVSFYLRMFNAEHPFTLPRDYNLTIAAVSASWTEGTGLDMEGYADSGSANWNSAISQSSGVTYWASAGGDYHAEPRFTASFESGIENIEMDFWFACGWQPEWRGHPKRKRKLWCWNFYGERICSFFFLHKEVFCKRIRILFQATRDRGSLGFGNKRQQGQFFI